jgi:hypothetical protein
VLKGFDADFEVALFVAPLLAKLPQQSDRFLEGRRVCFGCSSHTKTAAIMLPYFPVFIGFYTDLLIVETDAIFTLMSIILGSLRPVCFRGRD